ncbi:MAG: hypothetical protein ACR2KW_07155 [Rubrobacter sp.]
MELEGRNAHLSLGAGKKMWILDSLVTFKLTGEDTNGEMALIETLVPPESGDRRLTSTSARMRSSTESRESSSS